MLVHPIQGVKSKQLRAHIEEKKIRHIRSEYTPIKKRQNYRMPDIYRTGSIALSKQQWDIVKKIILTKKVKATETDRYIQTCMLLHYSIYNCKWKAVEPDPLKRQLRSLSERWRASKIWYKICKALELPQL